MILMLTSVYCMTGSCLTQMVYISSLQQKVMLDIQYLLLCWVQQMFVKP